MVFSKRSRRFIALLVCVYDGSDVDFCLTIDSNGISRMDAFVEVWKFRTASYKLCWHRISHSIGAVLFDFLSDFDSFNRIACRRGVIWLRWNKICYENKNQNRMHLIKSFIYEIRNWFFQQFVWTSSDINYSRKTMYDIWWNDDVKSRNFHLCKQLTWLCAWRENILYVFFPPNTFYGFNFVFKRFVNQNTLNFKPI